MIYVIKIKVVLVANYSNIINMKLLNHNYLQKI